MPNGSAPWPIEKRYDGGVFQVQAADFQAYADATDDPLLAYRGDYPVAPPMFHVRPFIDLMMSMARDPALGIDMLRLVHGEHFMSFHDPLRDGDALAVSGILRDVSEKRTGTVFTFALQGHVAGTLVLDGMTSYFVRADAPPADAGPKAPRAAPPEPPPASWSITQPVSVDQADRYAPASGDFNPIHLDPQVARGAGLPGVILHGLCSLAFAQRDLIARACAGDPSRLQSLRVRFAAPVFPGEVLRMDVWDDGSGKVSFVTYNTKNKPVLVGGEAVVIP